MDRNTSFPGLRMAAAFFAPKTPTTEPDDGPEASEKETDMSDNPAAPEANAGANEAAITAAHDAGRKAERDRMNAVFASEHFAGREARACAYLKTSMSAEEIGSLLANDPKAEAADPAAAARSVMLGALGDDKNADIDSGEAPKPTAQDVWGKATAKLYGTKEG